MKLPLTFIDIAGKYIQLPFEPFCTYAREIFIKNYLLKHNIAYTANDFALVAKVLGKSEEKAKPKLVFISHIDHPGIILKNAKEGIILGSLGEERLGQVLHANGPITIRIFDTHRAFLGKGVISGIKKHAVQIQTNVQVQPNFTATFDFDHMYLAGELLGYFSADNDIATLCLLDTLPNFKPQEFDIYCVFTFFEETHQISAYHLAKHNILNLTSEDVVINLECNKIKYHKDDTEKLLRHDQGLILQIMDIGCVYGYHFNQRNLAEDLVALQAENARISLQIGPTWGSCDARPFSFFKLTPNIVTLSVPNEHKHNIKDSNELTSEEVRITDILECERLLKQIANTNVEEFAEVQTTKRTNYTLDAKTNTNITNSTFMRKKAVLNERLAVAYRRVIQQCKFYPTSAIESVADVVLKIFSYCVYVAGKFRAIFDL